MSREKPLLARPLNRQGQPASKLFHTVPAGEDTALCGIKGRHGWQTLHQAPDECHGPESCCQGCIKVNDQARAQRLREIMTKAQTRSKR